MKIIIIIIFTAIYGTYALLQNMDTKQWLEDIEQYQQRIETLHINPFSKISKEEFENEVNSLKREVNDLSDFEIIIELMKITRKIGDGHTSVSLREEVLHFFSV